MYMTDRLLPTSLRPSLWWLVGSLRCGSGIEQEVAMGQAVGTVTVPPPTSNLFYTLLSKNHFPFTHTEGLGTSTCPAHWDPHALRARTWHVAAGNTAPPWLGELRVTLMRMDVLFFYIWTWCLRKLLPPHRPHTYPFYALYDASVLLHTPPSRGLVIFVSSHAHPTRLCPHSRPSRDVLLRLPDGDIW